VKAIVQTPPKRYSVLAREWDQLAEERHRQIASGEDLSFEHVVVPTMLRLFENSDSSLVLDIGSGTGDFTLRLAQVATKVIGVEPSRASVIVARATCRAAHNVSFIQARLEEAGSMLQGESATAAVACMSLMTTPDLRGFAKALASLLPGGAAFVATLSHPCFWPRYWGYETEAWFDYAKETFIEAPFVISNRRTEFRTTHVHRPLEQYVNVFASAGFRLEALLEPMPTPKIEALYPRPWKFPRFIGLRWVKNRKYAL
jgi:SAM-dependent methyltransferase